MIILLTIIIIIIGIVGALCGLLLGFSVPRRIGEKYPLLKKVKRHNFKLFVSVFACITIVGICNITKEALITIKASKLSSKLKVQSLLPLVEGRLTFFTIQPTKEAYELSKQIPENDNQYAMALKFVAEGEFKKALKHLSNERPKTSKETSKVLRLEGLISVYLGDYIEAGRLMREAISHDSSNLQLHEELAIVLNVLGHSEEALERLNNLLALYKNIPNFNTTKQSLILLQVADTLRLRGRYTEALKNTLDCKKNLKKALSAYHEHYASAIAVEALIRQDMGQYKKGMELLLQSSSVVERIYGKTSHQYLELRHLHARSLRKQGNLKEAARILVNLKKAWISLDPAHPSLGYVQNTLGLVYHYLDKDNKAILEFESSMRILSANLSPSHPENASVLSNLAITFQTTGDITKSFKLLQDCLDIYDKNIGTRSISAILARHNMAYLHAKNGDYDKAKALYLEVLTSFNDSVGENHPEIGVTYSSLGVLLARNKEYEEALTYLTKAYNIRAHHWGKENARLMLNLRSLGRLNFLMGKYEEANSFYQRALSICEKSYDPAHRDSQKLKKYIRENAAKQN